MSEGVPGVSMNSLRAPENFMETQGSEEREEIEEIQMGDGIGAVGERGCFARWSGMMLV